MLESERVGNAVLDVGRGDEIIGGDDVAFSGVYDVGELGGGDEALPGVLLQMTFFGISTLNHFVLPHWILYLRQVTNITRLQSKNRIHRNSPKILSSLLNSFLSTFLTPIRLFLREMS